MFAAVASLNLLNSDESLLVLLRPNLICDHTCAGQESREDDGKGCQGPEENRKEGREKISKKSEERSEKSNAEEVCAKVQESIEGNEEKFEALKKRPAEAGRFCS